MKYIFEVHLLKEPDYKSYDELSLFLNADTVVKVLGNEPSLAYELIREKDFPTPKISNRLVVPKEKFIELLKIHTEKRGTNQNKNYFKIPNAIQDKIIVPMPYRVRSSRESLMR